MSLVTKCLASTSNRVIDSWPTIGESATARSVSKLQWKRPSRETGARESKKGRFKAAPYVGKPVETSMEDIGY